LTCKQIKLIKIVTILSTAAGKGDHIFINFTRVCVGGIASRCVTANQSASFRGPTNDVYKV